MNRTRIAARLSVLAVLCCVAISSCKPGAGEVERQTLAAEADRAPALLDPPAAVGAFAANLATVGGRLAATWLEPAALASGAGGHRLRFAALGPEGWSEAISIAEGGDFFANWADFPELVEAGDGTLYAHWLAKTAAHTYAYSVFLARSIDRGRTWEAMGKLNSDDTPTEHGFVALVPEGKGARAFWLDGREMLDDRPMALRSARVGEANRVEEIVDARVCECCGTDAAVTDEGPIVVYRDRSELEVRDVFAVRSLVSGWTEPAPVHADEWRIEGCPVNGPAIDARGDEVAVAWFTASNGEPKVLVAFSDDSGASFQEPVVVDAAVEGSLVLGRVDVVLEADGSARVSWVAQTGDHAEIRLQRVGAGGSSAPRRVVAQTSPARASGFPILEAVGDVLYLAWVEVGEDRAASRVHVRAL